MTFEDFLKLTRRQAVAIAVGLLTGLFVALTAFLVTPASFKASAEAYVRVKVSPEAEISQQTGPYYTASQLATSKVKPFVPVFTSETVAQGVVDSLNLDMTPAELSRSLSATNKANTLTITVTATASSEETARSIADEVVRQSAEQIKQLEGEDSPIEIVLMTPASLAPMSQSPSGVQYLCFGLPGGVVLGYVLAFAREVWDRRVRSAADLAAVVDHPVLGVIPVSDAIAHGRASAGGSGAEEAFRKLRTNLRYANVDKGVQSFVVTSGVQGDGKSTVASNLARVMALAGQSVVLIDGDLRRPRHQAEGRGGRRRPGLTQLLVGSTSLDAVLVQSAVPGLQVIPAGDPPPNPSELLGSERMSDLVTYLASKHVVIIDAPAALPVTDAAALGAHTDGVLLVARAGRTTNDQLSQTVEAIRQGGGTVVGAILNQAPSPGRHRLDFGGDEAPAPATREQAQSRHGAGVPGRRAVEWPGGAPAPGPTAPARAR